MFMFPGPGPVFIRFCGMAELAKELGLHRVGFWCVYLRHEECNGLVYLPKTRRRKCRCQCHQGKRSSDRISSPVSARSGLSEEQR